MPSETGRCEGKEQKQRKKKPNSALEYEQLIIKMRKQQKIFIVIR
jgi:hypothetical protein